LTFIEKSELALSRIGRRATRAAFYPLGLRPRSSIFC